MSKSIHNNLKVGGSFTDLYSTSLISNKNKKKKQSKKDKGVLLKNFLVKQNQDKMDIENKKNINNTENKNENNAIDLEDNKNTSEKVEKKKNDNQNSKEIDKVEDQLNSDNIQNNIVEDTKFASNAAMKEVQNIATISEAEDNIEKKSSEKKGDSATLELDNNKLDDNKKNNSEILVSGHGSDSKYNGNSSQGDFGGNMGGNSNSGDDDYSDNKKKRAIGQEFQNYQNKNEKYSTDNQYRYYDNNSDDPISKKYSNYSDYDDHCDECYYNDRRDKIDGYQNFDRKNSYEQYQNYNDYTDRQKDNRYRDYYTYQGPDYNSRYKNDSDNIRKSDHREMSNIYNSDENKYLRSENGMFRNNNDNHLDYRATERSRYSYQEEEPYNEYNRNRAENFNRDENQHNEHNRNRGEHFNRDQNQNRDSYYNDRNYYSDYRSRHEDGRKTSPFRGGLGQHKHFDERYHPRNPDGTFKPRR